MDKAIVVADPVHLAIELLLVRMKNGLPPPQGDAELDACKAALLSGLEHWAADRSLTIQWSDKPGRKEKGRHYRIAYLGDAIHAANSHELYDALDAEMLRLMLL